MKLRLRSSLRPAILSLRAALPLVCLLAALAPGLRADPDQPQELSFGPTEDLVAGRVFTLTASATSWLPVSFTAVAGPGTVRIVGDQITGLTPGLVTLRASQPGDTTYLPAPPVDRTFKILPGPFNSGEGLVLTRTPTGDPAAPWRHEVDFWAKAGRTYVVEETEDLANPKWRRLPGLIVGEENGSDYGQVNYRWSFMPDGSYVYGAPEAALRFDSNTDRHFVRLRYVDNLVEPFLGDHDRDGVTNYQEVSGAQTDPFAYPDEDLTDAEPGGLADGLPDAWELYRFGTLAKGPADTDAAGRTLADLYAAERRDTDADGLPDDWEKFRCGGVLTEGPATVHDGKTNLARFREDRVKLAEHKFGAQAFRYDSTFIGNAFDAEPLETNRLTVRLRGNQGGSMLVQYVDDTYSTISNIRVWPSNRDYGFVRPDINDPATHYADYVGEVVGGVYGYTFSATPATGSYVARDLLRSLDGRPLRRSDGSGPTRLAFAPLAITSLPLREARPDRYPAVLRDFPYYGDNHRTFPDFGNGLSPTANVIHPELIGGPLLGLPSPDLSRLGLNSGQALAQRFTLPDAFAFSIEQRPPLSDAWIGIEDTYEFFPHANDVGSEKGEKKNRQAFTLELHFRLDYDLATTVLQVASDDSCWLFIDGRKVVDLGVVDSETSTLAALRDRVKTRDGIATPFLESPTGSCVVDLFFSERFTSNSKLTLLANTALRPIYVYQVVVDSDCPAPLTYTLTQKPPGMEIDARTGKIVWDYYGRNSDSDPNNNIVAGNHAVTVVVSDARGHSDTQSFTISLTL